MKVDFLDIICYDEADMRRYQTTSSLQTLSRCCSASGRSLIHKAAPGIKLSMHRRIALLTLSICRLQLLHGVGHL